MSKAKLTSLALLFSFVLVSCSTKKRVYNPNASYDNEPTTVHPTDTTGPIIDDGAGIVVDNGNGEDWENPNNTGGADQIPGNTQGTPVNHPFVNPVRFAYDSAIVGQAYDGMLKSLAGYISAKPTYHLTINGHCDERGSEEYNRALSEKRALAVKDALIAHGAPAERLNTVGYGEEKPENNSKSPEAYAQNRRANFDVFAK